MKILRKKILKEEEKDDSEYFHLKEMIKKIIGTKFKTWYSDYTSISDSEERFDVNLDFEVNKIVLWEVTNKDRENIINWKGKPIYQPKEESKYEGTVHLDVKKILITNDEGYILVAAYDDVPDWIWNQLEETLEQKVEDWFPGVYVDFNINLR